MPAPLRIAVLGCGRVADLVHLTVLPRLHGVSVVALADSDAERRGRARRRVPEAAAYESYHELLAASRIDAAVICLPTALHAEAAVAALRHGAHVYLEKPLAATPAAGRRILEEWQRAGGVGMVGFNYRFNPLYVDVKRRLDRGELGALVAVRTVFSAAMRNDLAWRARRDEGGGVLLDLASHHVDLVRFLTAHDVVEVHAMVHSQRSEHDTAVLQMRLTGGLLVQSFCSLSAIEDDRLEIYGEAGRLVVDRYLSLEPELTGPTRASARLRRLGHAARTATRVGYLVEKLRAPGNEPSYAAALAHFVTAVRERRPASPDFRDGYHSLAAVAAAEASARSGRAVRVERFETATPEELIG